VKPCLLIPNYNHGATMPALLETLAPLGLPCLIVDDGSGPETQAMLEELERKHDWVQMHRRPRNGGKGAALRTGFLWAEALGFTHALQIDADGQHAATDVPRLLDAAKSAPRAMVLGVPIFEHAPAGRRYGHWVSCVWVWIETWSFDIRDPLCGLRCMPLDSVLRVLRRTSCGDRMDFDVEIAVRVFWEGAPVLSVPVRVRYFAGGLSHFDLLRDNLRISWAHTRLCLGMLWRWPRLLARSLGW
jgi:glycosyltransferase involved in cell wall biosynthesis